MITMANIIGRFGADYLAQYGASVLPSQRQAIIAMKNCRSMLGPGMLAQCGDCGGFPGGFVCLTAELVGIAEGEVLGRYVLPQFPASAGSVV